MKTFASSAAAATLAAAFFLTPLLSAAAPLPALRGDGARVVDESGKAITLRGCNLGNWLLLEAWMQKWDIEDQQTILRTLEQRFGKEKSQQLMETYRAGYVTPRDFELIKTFKFNVVRLPFESLLLMDESGQMRPDAFKWLDRALEMAENAGVYVILDMHGAPGRQSTDQCTGERGQNRLWSDESCQKRMTELWTKIAQRYRDRTVVAAYDLLNEPYADFHTDIRSNLIDLTGRCYKAIRSTGDNHLIIFPNALGRGVTFYGDVKAKGMKQVAFTDHYYAGLFGSPSTVASHSAVLGRTIPETDAYVQRVGSPMLIGEFNVVLERCGGDAMMRRYFDEFARRGWMGTMWSYKLLKPTAGVESDNWYMVTNADPLPAIDVRSSSLEDIEKYMLDLATMPLAVDEKLRSALTDEFAPPMPLPPLDPLPQSAPPTRAVKGWKLIDVDTDTKGGVSESSDGLAIFASGSDIFATRDSFSFLQQTAPPAATLIASIADLANSDVYAKAGLMIRFGDPSSSDYASSPFVMVHAFPDGGLGFTVRDRAGTAAVETKRIVGPLPRRVALVRDRSRVDAYADDGADGWVKLGSAEIAHAGPAQIGVAVCSHHGGLLTRALVHDLSLARIARLPGNISEHAKPASPAGSNLLSNPQFNFGWQDAKVESGKQYAFTILAHREAGGDLKGQTISIAIESTVNGKQVALAERSVDVEQLESAGGVSLLRVSAAAVSDQMRVLIRPPTNAACVVVENASLIPLPD